VRGVVERSTGKESKDGDLTAINLSGVVNNGMYVRDVRSAASRLEELAAPVGGTVM
jgi:hypothetical protein